MIAAAHLTSAERLTALVPQLFPATWLAVFTWLTLSGTSVGAWPLWYLLGMAVVGFAWTALLRRSDAMQVTTDHRPLFAASALLALAIFASEEITIVAGLVPPHAMPPQPGLLLCLLPLVVILLRPAWRNAMVFVFAAVCVWHFVAMPLEAVTGIKWSWHRPVPLPRDAGPLHFQASGLALQAYFFPGLFLPLFWLAWGPLRERYPQVPRWVWLALAFAWVGVAACVQSRSALVGAALAALIALVAEDGGAQRSRRLVVAALIALAAGLAYVALFADNKSGGGLRWAYFTHYIAQAFDAWLLVGHGVVVPPPARLMVPGLLPLSHSHNDIAQVLYSWGLLTLVAYGAFLYALLRVVFTKYVARGAVWPLCAFVTLLPNMVTDLGLHHFEKAALLVWLAAFCIVFRTHAHD